MNRRDFLKGAAVAVAATTIPFTFGRTKDIEKKKRTVEIDTEDGWKQIEMSYLKPGDVFRIKENGITVRSPMRAGGNPYLVEDDIWGIQIYKADKMPKKEVRKYTSTSTRNPWQIKES